MAKENEVTNILMDYNRLAKHFDCEPHTIGNIINYFSGKHKSLGEIKVYKVDGVKTNKLYDVVQFASFYEVWETQHKRRPRIDNKPTTQRISSVNGEYESVKDVMEEFGLNPKDAGKYFRKYSEEIGREKVSINGSRPVLAFTKAEAEKMRNDYTGQTDMNETEPSQVTIEEVTDPKKTLTVDEVMDVLKMMLMRY